MRVITPPLALPVTPDEFRNAVHIDAAENDDAITLLLGAAVDVIETATRRVIMPQTVAFVLPACAWSRWWVPVAPVISLVGAPEGYTLDAAHDEPQVLRASGAEAAELQVRVGYSEPAAIPAALRQAIILLAKEWHDAGVSIDAAGAENAKLSFGVMRLIRQRRYQRPCVIA